MKQLLVLLLFLCSTSVFAQDKIVKKDGAIIACRVVELKDSFVIYKKWTELNGDDYMMSTSEISAIHYADGKAVNMSETNSFYKPGNQNDGMRLYNDNVLLKIDAENRQVSPKVKKLRTIGWIGGGVLTAAAIVSCVVMPEVRDRRDSYYIGAACGVGAVAWTTSFLLAANHQKNKAQMLHSSTIFQQNFRFDNGSSLSLGADMIHDRLLSNHTVGLGLRYNF